MCTKLVSPHDFLFNNPLPPSTAPISVGCAFLSCFRVFQISAVKFQVLLQDVVN